TTNIPLLHAIAVHPAFQEGLTHTSFLDEYHLTDKHIAQSAKLPAEVLMAAAVQAVNNEIRMYNANSTGVQTNLTNPWKTLGPWRMLNEARIISCRYGQQEHKVALKPIVPGTWSIQLDDGIPERITVTCGIDNLVLLTRDTEQVRAYVQQYTDETQVMVRGQLYHLAHKQPPSVETSAGATRAASAQRMLTAPMAGTIIKVQVHDGDSVQAQQVLVILSAMKMEHAITAPYNGTVQHVYYQEGAVVRGGDTLVEMQ
ncbi:MAG: 3-methylcrotonyl-CoA carboxylase, partial [Ktedonobacteraceae bacterium]|nr:3-methylcrotonyl-CoA carboxylase [Ktedonobacteraceae bacterium]